MLGFTLFGVFFLQPRWRGLTAFKRLVFLSTFCVLSSCAPKLSIMSSFVPTSSGVGLHGTFSIKSKFRLPVCITPYEGVSASHFDKFSFNVFFLLHAAVVDCFLCILDSLCSSWSDVQIDKSSMNIVWLIGRPFVMSVKSRKKWGVD